MKSYILAIITFVIVMNHNSAQSGLELGQWKSHLSYKSGKWVTQSSDKIIYASELGLMMLDKEDLSVSFLSKDDGLTDANVFRMVYDTKNEQLIIVYNDNNIDIVTKNEVINIPFIKTNTAIVGSKKINDLYLGNNDFVYLATDFGVLGFDLLRYEFAFTTFTELKVTTVAVLDQILYAGTEKGLFKIDLSKEVNVTDFGSWQNNSKGLPFNKKVQELAAKNGKIYVAVNDDVYIETDSFHSIYSSIRPKDHLTYLSDDTKNTLVIGYEMEKDGSFSSQAIFINADNSVAAENKNCTNRARYALEDEKGRIWYADLWDPIRYTENMTSDCKNIRFDVPFSNEASKVEFKDNKAYVASGGVTADFQYANTLFGFYTLEDKKWENINQDNKIPLLSQDTFLNLYAIAPNPKTSDVYLGSYYNGIIRYNEVTQKAEHWNKDNSPLQGVVGDKLRTRIAGLRLDDKENLWISNYGSPKPLVVKTKNDEWYSFSVPNDTKLTDIVIDNQGNKWIVVDGIGNGFMVYHEGNDIATTADDKVRFVNKNNSEIKGNKVNCISIDLDGSVWVGTDQGPVVFDCGDPYSEACRGNTRKVVVEGIPAPLLGYEDILTIEVDGANRKWFGTRNGIFVQSPDGITEVDRFNTDNSPLNDDFVRELSFNPKSGEMFIVSYGGIQSYKTETLSGGTTHSSNVLALPNPVRPEYTGPIAIKGLARDANVKITDINGRLVYETKALGGQAIWDGNDYNGQRAATGVYLVFSASENTALTSSDTMVTKILMVN